MMLQRYNIFKNLPYKVSFLTKNSINKTFFKKNKKKADIAAGLIKGFAPFTLYNNLLF